MWSKCSRWLCVPFMDQPSCILTSYEKLTYHWQTAPCCLFSPWKAEPDLFAKHKTSVPASQLAKSFWSLLLLTRVLLSSSLQALMWQTPVNFWWSMSWVSLTAIPFGKGKFYSSWPVHEANHAYITCDGNGHSSLLIVFCLQALFWNHCSHAVTWYR